MKLSPSLYIYEYMDVDYYMYLAIIYTIVQNPRYVALACRLSQQHEPCLGANPFTPAPSCLVKGLAPRLCYMYIAVYTVVQLSSSRITKKMCMYDTQLCNMHQHQGLIVHIYM